VRRAPAAGEEGETSVLGGLTEGAAAVDDVGEAQAFEQGNIVGGIVFEVGILNQDVVAGGLADTPLHGLALTLVGVLGEDADGGGGARGGKGSGDGFGVVFGAIVDYEDFLLEAEPLYRDGDDALEKLAEEGALVISGNYYR
jgi:hypothetical protein